MTTIVVGGGFRGILSAYFLAQKGVPVTIVEQAPFLGGVLHGKVWNGYDLDLGCHVFDNVKDEQTDIILDILGDRYRPCTIAYTTKLHQHIQPGLAVANLAGVEPALHQHIVFEMLEANTRKHLAPTSCFDIFTQRYGQAAAEILEQAALKAYHLSSKEMAPEALELTLFNRIHLGGQEMALLLKQIPALDAILAASSSHQPLAFYKDSVRTRDFRNFYPTHGMRGFCMAAREKLEAMGVKILTGHTITTLESDSPSLTVSCKDETSTLTADQIIWTLGAEQLATLLHHEEPLEPFVFSPPIVLLYFTFPKSQEGTVDYSHDFDSDSLCFRISCPTRYGQGNAPEGMSYLCCEIPTHKESMVWENPEQFLEQAWQEARNFGFTTAERWQEHHVIKAPSSFRIIRPGYYEAVGKFAETCVNDAILFTPSPGFSKVQIMESARGIAASVGKAA